MSRMRCGAGLLAAWCVVAAVAQTDILTLKNKSDALSNAERSAVTDWVRTQTQVISGADQAAGRAALRELRSILRDATPSFEQALRPAVSQELGRAIPAAPPLAAMQLTGVLGDLGNAEALPALLNALQATEPSVRAAAAGSLFRLQAALVATGENSVSQAVQALEAAGRTETNPSVLMAIYRAMDYTRVQNPPNIDAIAAAVLRVLQARGQQASQGQLSGSGADGVGLEVFTRLRPNEAANEQQVLLSALYHLLHEAAVRYTSDGSLRNPKGRGLVQVRDRLEHFMLQTELKLIELAEGGAPSPTLQSAFKGGGAVADVKGAMNAWAGRLQGQVQGVKVIED